MLVLAIDYAKISALRHEHDASGLLVGVQHDHNLTLQIWYDLGFPTDAILEVVKGMYTAALGYNEWVPEVPVRHSGTRAPAFHHVQQPSSNLTYADDVRSILTTTTENLHIQAEKLSRYSDWAHMKVDTVKTVVTEIV
jgi:hypothetical protein